MLIDDRKIKIMGFVLLPLLLLKIALLVIFGPIQYNDTDQYVDYAMQMLQPSEELSRLDLTSDYYFTTAFRSIGYPATIAAAMMISPNNFEYVVVFFQIIVSMFAIWFVFRFAFAYCGSWWCAFLATTAHALNQALLLDQSLLSDSLSANALIIATCLMGERLMRMRSASVGTMLGLGFLVALAALFRDSVFSLQFLYYPLALYWVLMSPCMRRRKILLFVCFILPLFFIGTIYKQWNECRTGSAFITTGGQTAMLLPVVSMNLFRPGTLEADELLQDLPADIRDEQNAWDKVRSVNRYLHRQKGLTPLEISRFAYSKFFEYWFKYPLDMSRVVLSNMSRGQLRLPFMPDIAILNMEARTRDYDGAERHLLSRSELWEQGKREGRWWLFPVVMGMYLCLIVGVGISLVFLVLFPIITMASIVKRGVAGFVQNRKAVFGVLLWLLCIGYSTAYLLVHFELRYVEAVVVFGTIISIDLISRALVGTSKCNNSQRLTANEENRQ